MGFKNLRGVALPEEKQGLVRYTCLNYQDQPKWIQEKIQHLCAQCGGAHQRALFDVMTTRRGIVEIAMENNVSESVLYERRKIFYESWFKKKRTDGREA